MSLPQAAGWTRRRFLGGLTLAGTAGLLGLPPRRVGAELPPETTRLRLARTSSICQAPQYIAEALFEAEGFTDVQFVGDAGVDVDQGLIDADDVGLHGGIPGAAGVQQGVPGVDGEVMLVFATTGKAHGSPRGRWRVGSAPDIPRQWCLASAQPAVRPGAPAAGRG